MKGPLGWPINSLKVKLQMYSKCLLYSQWHDKELQRDLGVDVKNIFDIAQTKGSCLI